MVIIIGEEEAEKGIVQVKDMISSETIEVCIDDKLVEIVKLKLSPVSIQEIIFE